MLSISQLAGFGVLEENDPHWGSVVMLLHADGADGSTTIVDTKVPARSITAVGNAQLDTAIKKYGTAAIKLDGTGDYLSTPDSANFDFGTSPATIEAFVYIAGNSTVDSGGSRYATIISNFATSDTTYWGFQIAGNASTTGTSLVMQTALAGVSQIKGAAMTISQAEWHHIAVSWDSTGTYFALDGVVTAAAAGAFTQAVNGGTAPRVGSLSVTGYLRQLNGSIDELRITKGVARYKSDFTPPVQAFPSY